MYSLTLTQAPAVEPVSLDEAKQFCSIAPDFMLDNALLKSLISSARFVAESYTRRAFFSQSWCLSLDHWPLYFYRGSTKNISDTSYPYAYFYDAITIKLPKPRCISVDSITYLDNTGATQTIQSTNYYVDTASEPARLIPANNSYWPSQPLYIPGSIKINFTCGTYGDGEIINKVPGNVVTAIALLTAHYYSNREGDKPIPDAFYRLLDPVKFETFTYNLY